MPERFNKKHSQEAIGDDNTEVTLHNKDDMSEEQRAELEAVVKNSNGEAPKARPNVGGGEKFDIKRIKNAEDLAVFRTEEDGMEPDTTAEAADSMSMRRKKYGGYHDYVPQEATGERLAYIDTKHPGAISVFVFDSKGDPDLQAKAIEKAEQLQDWTFQHISTPEQQMIALDKLELKEDEDWKLLNDISLKDFLMKYAADEYVVKKIESLNLINGTKRGNETGADNSDDTYAHVSKDGTAVKAFSEDGTPIKLDSLGNSKAKRMRTEGWNGVPSREDQIDELVEGLEDMRNESAKTIAAIEAGEVGPVSEFIHTVMNNASHQLKVIEKADKIEDWTFEHIGTPEGQIIALDKLELDEKKFKSANKKIELKDFLLKHALDEKVIKKINFLEL